MPSPYHFARTPRWLAGHLVVLALAVTMVLLGRWQLDVSNAKHFDLQNFGYAFQGWAFATFTLVLWRRVVRDRGRAGRTSTHLSHDTEPVPTVPSASPTASPSPASVPQPPQPVAYRRYVMPQSTNAPARAEDELHAAYNDYLAKLARAAGEERT